jgi:hypothetical protein
LFKLSLLGAKNILGIFNLLYKIDLIAKSIAKVSLFQSWKLHITMMHVIYVISVVTLIVIV